MPSPTHSPRNSYTHSNNSSPVSRIMPPLSHSLNNTANSSMKSKKSLSFRQLSAIYNEIIYQWSTEQWLEFVDNSTETYLTLKARKNETLPVQTAIDRYHLSTGRILLRIPPECLLIRTESHTKTLFVPNSILSLENLIDDTTAHRLFHYKLMAIISHSHQTNSKLMFYKDPPSNSWSIYSDQPSSSTSALNILSEGEQQQLESFIEEINPIDPPTLTSPLSALHNHPIIYVYMPEKTKTRNE